MASQKPIDPYRGESPEEITDDADMNELNDRMQIKMLSMLSPLALARRNYVKLVSEQKGIARRDEAIRQRAWSPDS